MQFSAAAGQCLAEAAQAREAGYYTAAETIFDEAYREQFSAGFSDIASTCEAAVGNRFYSLKQSGKLFYYDVETREYALFAHLPARPHRPDWQGKSYADLSESDRETLDHTVSQLIAAVDSNVLYGYCATSGRIGTVDADGIHWSDVRLDNSLLMEQMGSDELSLEPLWNAYIEGNHTVYLLEPLSLDRGRQRAMQRKPAGVRSANGAIYVDRSGGDLLILSL